MRIEYKSERNGYSGVLYGDSSVSIFDPQGNEVLHTGFRSIHAMEKLRATVDKADKLLEMFRKTWEEDDEAD